jgi:hypothetical protein
MYGGLSQAQRLALQRQDAQFLPLPLNLGPAPHSMAAHLRHLVRLLRNPRSPSPCSDAIAHLTAVFDRTISAADRSGLACRQGCAHCCSQRVTVSPPEAFFVAAQLRARPGLLSAIEDGAARMRALADSRSHAPIACPLLAGSLCTVYAARPLACRGFVSLDVNACIAFERDGRPNVAMPAGIIEILYCCRMMLVAAQRLLGLKEGAYEMNAAVGAVLAAQDGMENRWLKGEAVLAHLDGGPPPPPDFNAEIQRMVAFIAPTL